MFPISDDNPTIRRPVATVALLAVTAAVWLVVQGGWEQVLVLFGGGGTEGGALALATSVCNYGMVPGELTGRAPVGLALPLGHGLACVVDRDPLNVLTPLLAIFLHGSWGHIAGNALYLWIFGNNIEDVMGRGRFVAFYVVCGLAAAVAQILVDPGSPIPMVGASGAISGVMGAYLVLFPRVRVNYFFYFLIFFRVIPLPAWLALLFWFGTQLLSGLPEVLSPNPEIAGGVAVWAHIGGFVAGALLVRWFEDPRLVAERRFLLESRGIPAG